MAVHPWCPNRRSDWTGRVTVSTGRLKAALVEFSQTTKEIQAAMTIATTACCSPQNAVKMHQPSASARTFSEMLVLSAA
jgi:hypothetical protein